MYENDGRLARACLQVGYLQAICFDMVMGNPRQK